MKILDKVAIGFLCLMIYSIYYSLFLLSIASIGFAAIALYQIFVGQAPFKKAIFLPFGALLLIFLVTFLSGMNSEDLGQWVRHLRMKLPFLILPPAFYILRVPVAKYFDQLCLLFFGIAIVSTIPVLVQFVDLDSMVALIKKGQSLKTPVDHIKYSIYLAFSIVIAMLFLIEKRFTNKYGKLFLLFGGIYLFVFLHLLAVRSGLAIFYLVGFILLLRYAIILRKPILYLLVVLLAITPFLAYKTIPTLKKKVEYMIYDYRMYQKGEGNNLSDSERLYSYEVGLEIFKESPILGSGIGDLRKLCEEKYKSKFQMDISKYPHNQFLFILAGSGILGLLLFLIGMCYPIFYFRKKQDSLFFAIWLIVMISFIVENTIERSYGISFFLLFFLGSMCKMQVDYFNEEIVSNPQSR